MVDEIKRSRLIDGLIGLTLFGIALWLRASSLAHFVTADEHNWVYRSGLFLAAFLRGDWPATSVWLTPAVTTTWLGSAGLAGYYWLHQAAIGEPLQAWLTSFSRTRVNLEVLLALRWPMALFSALMVALIYGLSRRRFSRPVAVLGAFFLLTGPHLLSVSRIIGHDAPATLFITASLLAFLIARPLLRDSRQRKPAWAWLAGSGVMAGLGVLSKAPAMFLIPFVGLVGLAEIWQQPTRWRTWLAALLAWGATLWLTFVIFWPAAWVSPLGQSWAVIEQAFLYSAGLDDADTEPFWSIPNLGPAYYLVNGAYKLSPLVMIGGLLALWAGGRRLRHADDWLRRLLRADIFWLLLFALLFGLFMTLGSKRSPRYILPALPALAYVAAWGWTRLVRTRWQPAAVAGLGAANLLLTLAFAPYYFTYFNPLLGGALTAPHVVRIGWGEGLDDAGRWLDRQPEARADHAGTRYTVALSPFYRGGLDTPTDPELDYVVFYLKQSQSGYPAPEILGYFEQQGPLHRVRLNGIDYAQIYQGPAMTPVDSQVDGPLAYRPSAIYAPIGQPFAVDVLWPAGAAAGKSVTLTAHLPGSNLALDAPGLITEVAPGVVVSRHQFNLPADLPRAEYELRLDGQPIGVVKARLLTVPANFQPLDTTVQFLKLRGMRRQLEADRLLIDLAWQAWPVAINDYTVFIQLLDENGQRVTGVDVAPQPGFTALDRKEIMLTHYELPIPPDTPSGSYQLLIGLYYFAGDELINVGAETLPEPVILDGKS